MFENMLEIPRALPLTKVGNDFERAMEENPFVESAAQVTASLLSRL